MRMVAEGVKTAASVDELSTKMGVEMPICQQVFEASGSTSTVLRQPIETVWSLTSQNNSVDGLRVYKVLCVVAVPTARLAGLVVGQVFVVSNRARFGGTRIGRGPYLRGGRTFVGKQ